MTQPDPLKSISSALLLDVKLLVWKDEDGRVVVHRTPCKFLGHKGNLPCGGGGGDDDKFI